MLPRVVLVNEMQKYSTDVAFHIATILWIQPYNFSITISSWWGCWRENIKLTSTPPPRTNRNRKIIWFNPQYSGNVKSNMGRTFLHLIDKYFPQHPKYWKLFNTNNLKISYSCMPNMTSAIRNHNTCLLKNPTPTDIKESSCRQKAECPLDKKCLSGYLVYNASVYWLDTNKTKSYYGTCEKNL